MIGVIHIEWSHWVIQSVSSRKIFTYSNLTRMVVQQSSQASMPFYLILSYLSLAVVREIKWYDPWLLSASIERRQLLDQSDANKSVKDRYMHT